MDETVFPTKWKTTFLYFFDLNSTILIIFQNRSEEAKGIVAATMKDIAKETGLSLATISKYMNGGTLREKNRVAIERAIQKLDYTVNEYARGLKSNRSRTVGIIIPELSQLFSTRIITVIEDILRAHGYSPLICDCHTNETLECDMIKFLLGKRVDGIINMPVCTDGRHLLPALDQGIPVVLLDRPIPSLQEKTDAVLLDNEAASALAVRELVEHGHRKIGILTGPESIYTSRQRLLGYRNSLASYGIPAPAGLAVCGDYTLEGGYRQIRKLVENVPDMTAVFVTNYEMTLGAVIAVNEMGIRIPQELSLIGFDNLDLARIAHPRLTIVSQPIEQIGTETARLILDRMEKKPSKTVAVSLSPVFQEGESVAKR